MTKEEQSTGKKAKLVYVGPNVGLTTSGKEKDAVTFVKNVPQEVDAKLADYVLETFPKWFKKK